MVTTSSLCSQPDREGILWVALTEDHKGTTRNGGTVFVRASGTLGVFTIALKMTIRQIETDRYLLEKGLTICSSPKSFSPVSDFFPEVVQYRLIKDSYLAKKSPI